MVPLIPRVYWTIDGLPVDLVDWDLNVIANGGYDGCTGNMRSSIARRWPSRIQQGARMTGYEATGAVIYEGTLNAPPSFHEGLAVISTAGNYMAVADAAGRLLYQSRDYSLFSDGGSPPMNFGPNTQYISAQNDPADLFWSIPNGQAATSGDIHVLGAWFVGCADGITRYAVDIDKPNNDSNWDLRTEYFVGPNGTRTAIQDHGLGGAQPTSFDVTFDSGGADGFCLGPRCNTNETVSGVISVRASNLRVNGIAAGDTFTTGQVAADIGARCGLDTSGVQDSGTNALPFDLNSGNSWADDGLSYMASLDDWSWGVYEDLGLAAGLSASGPLLVYEPWTALWTVRRAYDAEPNLSALQIYNRVVVKYTTTAGAPAQAVATVADIGMTDPLPGITATFTDTELTDPQADDSLASQLAQTLVARYATPRYQGTIDILGAFGNGRERSPFTPRPGDMVTIGDWGPAQNLACRIYEVQRKPDSVSIGVEGPVTAAGLIALQGLVLARV